MLIDLLKPKSLTNWYRAKSASGMGQNKRRGKKVTFKQSCNIQACTVPVPINVKYALVKEHHVLFFLFCFPSSLFSI